MNNSSEDLNRLIPKSPDYEGDAPDPSETDKKLFSSDDPMTLFAEWLELAKDKEMNDCNAMSLATVDGEGLPNVRMVLLKGADRGGFVWYTNLESAKGNELIAHPKAALCFHWKSLRRQVRVRGTVEPVSAEEADAYFQERARHSRIGAWASDQSRPVSGRFELEKRVAQYAAKFGLGEVPRPPHWSGFRLKPVEIEFWRDGAFRLHDRLVFRRADEKTDWAISRLFP